MAKKYDILDDTWCIYCAEEWYVPAELQAHVLNIHEGTYAADAITEAKNQVDMSS